MISSKVFPAALGENAGGLPAADRQSNPVSPEYLFRESNFYLKKLNTTQIRLEDYYLNRTATLTQQP